MPVRKSRPLLAAAVLLVAGGCAGTDLGRIDETRDERDDMAGPGVFADQSGETPLKWTVGDTRPSATEPTLELALDEQVEFELFKEWRRLRAEGSDSPEYREFLQWLEFREFKDAQ
ncbi:MAG TPA: hypothetical protein VIW27_00615 [Gammaproteobacteria bacterium]|jgi:hypothetical protein